MEEFAVDVNEITEEGIRESVRETQLIFRINNTMPMTDEHTALIKELMEDRIGEGTRFTAPFNLVASKNLGIGKNVYIGGNFLGMCRGGITIEDDVMIAANVSVLSNNHDLYSRNILLCKPVTIKEGTWIGANATILPGVTIGRYAVVGAASVVTHDVADYEVVVGSPARPIKTLDGDRFPQ